MVVGELRPGKPGGCDGDADATLLVWDMASETWPARPAARSAKPEEIKRYWDDLSADAATAFRAVHSMAESPVEALPFLRASLKPARGLDQKALEERIAKLDDKQYAVREAASKELVQMRDEIDPILKRWLEKSTSAESRRRIKDVLSRPVPIPACQALRDLRALDILERIGNAEAQALLKEIATGAPEARLTRDAKASLERLQRRR